MRPRNDKRRALSEGFKSSVGTRKYSFWIARSKPCYHGFERAIRNEYFRVPTLDLKPSDSAHLSSLRGRKSEGRLPGEDNWHNTRGESFFSYHGFERAIRNEYFRVPTLDLKPSDSAHLLSLRGRKSEGRLPGEDNWHNT
ncbi:hypothetical protein NDU88_001458 [Pleurodeles waltl]|uniref:Uncharacterized protein n=1 Tax=Pleurodeles waltl TaxID=8319 RepID=A0AAV7KPJ1_PLEWA|nr:hypothetical protein NDU88_001458 [Pleurodeles waltl]